MNKFYTILITIVSILYFYLFHFTWIGSSQTGILLQSDGSISVLDRFGPYISNFSDRICFIDKSWRNWDIVSKYPVSGYPSYSVSLRVKPGSELEFIKDVGIYNLTSPGAYTNCLQAAFISNPRPSWLEYREPTKISIPSLPTEK